MTQQDDFEGLARYYDSIMDHIDYDRWLVVTTLVADWLNVDKVNHVDIACGTGVLLKKLRQHGWTSIGLDLSPAMAKVANSGPYAVPTFAANMCALPLGDASSRLLTCFFDSLNFLLEKEELVEAFKEAARVMDDDGIYYFDMITERMVTEYFADQSWSERSGKFKTSWEGKYDSKGRILDLHVQVHSRPPELIRERVYYPSEIHEALDKAGLDVVVEVDSETWGKPSHKTVRVDMMVMKRSAGTTASSAKKLVHQVQDVLSDLG